MGNSLLAVREINHKYIVVGKSVNGSIFGAKMGCRCWNLYGIAFRQDWEGERGAADRIYHCFDIKKYRRCAEMARAAIKTGNFSRLRQTEYRRTPLLI